jgi:amino acid adenylation domain-containing protein
MSSLSGTILRAAEAHPSRLAVDGARQGQLTYAQLMDAVSGLLPVLEGKHSIGVLSNRRAETYQAVLAPFFAGKPFTPLNPSFPLDRLRAIAALSGVDLVLCDSSTRDLAGQLGLPFHCVADAAVQEASTSTVWPHLAKAAMDDEAIAYRMFTSGSTGEPKGVPIPCAALAHYVDAIRELLEFPQGARFSQCFDISFDLSMHDIFVALASGGTIVPASDMQLLMPHSYIAKRAIDVWFSVPMLAMVAARGQGEKPVDHRLSIALFCGEPLPMDYVRRFRPFLLDGAPLWNLYGPTEATIAFTAQCVGEDDEPFAIAPLGDPFGDNRIAILDDAGNIAPVTEGALGELLLGGPQVFGGYLPARIDPFVDGPSGRFYRSGDLVRFEGGKLHHLGRIDSQVKLRGHRIELAEVEAAFRNLLGCEAAAAFLHGELDAAELRVAYQRSSDIEDTGPIERALPDYMVPGRILRLAELPVNVNGKVDRKQLAGMEWP